MYRLITVPAQKVYYIHIMQMIHKRPEFADKKGAKRIVEAEKGEMTDVKKSRVSFC